MNRALSETHRRFIQVPLSEAAVLALAKLQRHPDESFSNIIERLACECIADFASVSSAPAPMAKVQGNGAATATPTMHSKHAKYSAVFLGTRVSENSLGELFGAIVDITASVAPDALERLSGKQARTRRYVSRRKDAIHPGRPDLKTIQTESAWWVSANIGTGDLIRGLKALCACAGLEFGNDLRFPAA